MAYERRYNDIYIFISIKAKNLDVISNSRSNPIYGQCVTLCIIVEVKKNRKPLRKWSHRRGTIFVHLNVLSEIARLNLAVSPKLVPQKDLS